MPKSPAFQFYPNDWLSSPKITLMSPAEEGGYIRLLAYAWSEEDCGLPDDDDVLAALSRLGEAWGQGSGAKIRRCFKAKDGRIFNSRLLSERQKQEKFRKGKSEAGKKGAKSRWNKGIVVDSTAIPLSLTKDSSSSSSSSPSSSSEQRHKATQKKASASAKSSVFWNGENFDVTEIMLKRLLRCFDMELIMEQLPHADNWISNHPKKKRKRWGAYLQNWMEIAVKKTSSDGHDAPRRQSAQKSSDEVSCQGCGKKKKRRDLYPGGVCVECYSAP